MNNHDIHPLDILSGKVAQNKHGTFWFKDAGNNVVSDGFHIDENLHRENDLPAAIYSNGTRAWYKNGKVHRDNDLPAIIRPNGDQEWHREGEYHRDNDLPAIIYSRRF